MKMRLVAASVAFFCASNAFSQSDAELRRQPIHLAQSASELSQQLRALKAVQERQGDGIDRQMSQAEGGEPSITNNQEQGVDEGDIVKAMGDYLLVLRKGELYSVKVRQGESPEVVDSVSLPTDAYLKENVWYDEMLTFEGRVYVVGYRYATLHDVQDSWLGATELNSFRLRSDGRLERLGRMFAESSDYYSSTNYASRLVDGRLVLYMPRMAFREGTSLLNAPAKLRYLGGGKFERGAPLVTWQNTYLAPVVPDWSFALHTIASCALPADGSFSCDTRAFLGNWSRELYVSKDSLFLWLDGIAFRWKLGTLDLTAHAVQGYPRDQFSFRSDGASLHAVVTVPQGTGDFRRESVDLLSIPLSGFDTRAMQETAFIPSRTLLRESAQEYVTLNRFVGNEVVSAVSRWQERGARTRVTLAEVGGSRRWETRIEGELTRVEPLGDSRAFLAWQKPSANGETLLSVKVMDLAHPSWSEGWTDFPGLREGESRSHGFFFKPDAPGSGQGVLGLPVVNEARPSAATWWGQGISNIAFFRVALGLSPLGVVSSSPDQEQHCTTSCIDWYGNTRPIFWRERVFALMGSEIQEVRLGNSNLLPVASRVILEPQQ